VKWGKRVSGRGHSLCKGPGAGRAWVMEEHQGARVAGAEGARGTEGGGRQGGDRQVVQGPVGCREDLGFEPEGGRSHGGLWAGEGGPGSALTGAPWWLWEDRLRGQGQGLRGSRPGSWGQARQRQGRGQLQASPGGCHQA
jgi:hypothetical protein